jgi:hypothetical protein
MGAFRGHSFRLICVSLLLSALLGATASAELETGNEREARRRLAEKLLRLGRSLDMKEASYPESAGGGGQSFNRNDGNSFTSNTTYHSNVWSRCLEWVGGQFCNSWLDPYVSAHGFGGDKSPLEGVVASHWQQRKTDGDSVGPTHVIWQVERADGGSNLDADGKFDLKGLADWRLLPDVRKDVEKVGFDTAVRQISLTYDDSTGKGENTMPNIESLRLMASRWTKMYRNRMVASLGESRAMSTGVEAALGEDVPDCDAYSTAVQNDQEITGIQERIQAQPVLQPETQAESLDRRVAACRALKAASVFAVNPTARGADLVKGDPNEEQIDRWKMRLNIAAIDFAGVDVSKMPRPGYGRIRQEDLSSELRDYNVGGLTFKKVRRTPRQQIDGYNKALESAAAGMSEVASRSDFIKDNSKEYLKFRIRPTTMSAVRINDLTPEMRAELRGTGHPRSGPRNPQDPSLNLEQTPSELTAKALR